jgi:hypothetical protein
MAKRNTRRHGNPDFRHRGPGPMPSVAEIEAELTALLTPALFAPRQLERRAPRHPARRIRLRERILTLPGMVALGGSLVWRRWGSLAEGQRGVVQDGLLWGSPLQVREQASAKRLDTGPASARAAVFAAVRARLQAQPPPQLPGLARWTEVRARFPRLAMVEGSTLEALGKKTQPLPAQPGLGRAGRVRGRGEAFTPRPLGQLSTEDAPANEKRFAPEILSAVPLGGLLGFAWGFLSFVGFADVTEQPKYFVARLRQHTA